MNKENFMIIAFVGMPGAGKSSCVEYLLKNYPELPPVLYFGGIIIDEVKRRGLEINEANERLVREELRSNEGKDVCAKRISPQIDKLMAGGETRIAVDGLYSWSEYKYFKERYGDSAVIVAIAVPRTVRHERLANRPVRPLTNEQVTSPANMPKLNS